MNNPECKTETAQPVASPATGSESVVFKLYEYNPRRKQRGKEAARVEVIYPDGETELLWMSVQNIRDNIKTHGPSDGLTAALEAYRNNGMPGLQNDQALRPEASK